MESVEHSWIYVDPTPDKADTETTITYLSEWRSRASGERSAIGKLTGESGGVVDETRRFRTVDAGGPPLYDNPTIAQNPLLTVAVIQCVHG
jgi:hypothetical protein